MEKPYIGIPIGDPSGIGPEILIKALKNKEIYDYSNPVVVGSSKVIKQMIERLSIKMTINIISSPQDGSYSEDFINIIDVDNIDTSKLEFGKVQAESGKAAYEYICKVVDLAKQSKVSAIATTPINKEAIKSAGIDFIGHTEMLASMTQTLDPLTMFQVNDLRVFFLSRHVSLKDACGLVKMGRIIDYVQRCSLVLTMLGIPESHIAIAGLNPHSGEHGLFGNEEELEIRPAVSHLQNKGLKVEGPVPADSVFYLALKGKYDAVLSLYHDQGHIATKMVDFEKTISLTLGLPFLRTSVDHGTAFDIAGKGLASSVSMEEAIRLAALYCTSYRCQAASL